MNLSENQGIVDSLKQILEYDDYLEYKKSLMLTESDSTQSITVNSLNEKQTGQQC